MDESTKIVIAYAELVLGFPLLVAKIVWFAPRALLGKVLGMICERMDEVVNAAMEGFIAILAACLVFNHFQLQTAWAVPVTLIIVNGIWGWGREEAFRSWSSATGVLCGFLLYPDLLAHFIAKYSFARLLFA